MDRSFFIFLLFVILCVRHTCTFGFNPITFVKNWSLRGSAAIPMPKNFLDTVKLISREGYGWESYHVMTKDGYILPLTRITSRHKKFVGQRPPILMMHGVFATSEAWANKRRREGLSYRLTDMGFDIWLADMRGNHYGKHHKYLLPGNPKFWDFSFHENGLYDLPAFMDFIISKTGAPQVGYIGHSMGTTVLFAFLSLRPEYNSKIGAAVMLAPVGPKFPFEEIYNPATRLLLTQYDLIYESLISAGIHEILPRTPKLVYNVRKYCTRPPEQDYCLDFIGTLYGEHRANLNRKTLGEEISYLPAGTSAKTLHHLAQIYRNGFSMYDYGPRLNMLKYNTTTPPAYPLNRVTAPMLLLYGENDPLTSSQGVDYLAHTMPGVKWAKLVPDHKFTHADFVYGINSNQTIDGDIIQFLKTQLQK